MLYASDSVLDAMLEYLKTNVVRVMACSALPTTYNEAAVLYNVFTVVMSSADFTIGDHPTSGRQLTVAEKVGSTAITTNVIYYAMCSLTELLYVTECPNQLVTAGADVLLGEWTIRSAVPEEA